MMSFCAVAALGIAMGICIPLRGEHPDARQKNHTALEPLLKQLADPATAHSAWTKLYANSEVYVPHLLNRLSEDDAAFPRYLQILCRLGPPDAAVAHLTRDYRQSMNASARLEYLRAFTLASNPKILSVLIEALDEPGVDAREIVWSRLSRFPEQPLIPHRERLLSAGESAIQELRLAPHALRVIGRIGHPQGAAFFIPFLDSDEDSIQIAAIEALPMPLEGSVSSRLKAIMFEETRSVPVRMVAWQKLAKHPVSMTDKDWMSSLENKDLRRPVLGALQRFKPAELKAVGQGLEQALWRLAQSKEPEHLDALAELGRMPTESAKGKLRKYALVRDRPAPARILSLKYLASEPALIHVMVELVAFAETESDYMVLAQGLSRAPVSNKVLESLLRLHDQCDPGSRTHEEIVAGLAKYKDKKAKEKVTEWFRSSGPKTSIASAAIASQLNLAGNEQASAEIYGQLLSQTSSKDTALRRKAVETIGMSFGVPFMLPHLGKWLTDPDDQVAASAIHWATVTADSRALGPLLDALRQSERKPVVRALLERLPAYKDTRLFPPIIDRLKTKDPQVQEAAARALSRLTFKAWLPSNTQPSSDGRFKADYEKWSTWWEEARANFDFVDSYLDIAAKVSRPVRTQMLAELKGEWARDPRMERYVATLLDSEDFREKQMAVLALQWVAAPSFSLIEDLVNRLEALKNTQIINTVVLLTCGQPPDPFTPPRTIGHDRDRILSAYNRWWERESGKIRTWWQASRQDFRKNEELYRRKFYAEQLRLTDIPESMGIQNELRKDLKNP